MSAYSNGDYKYIKLQFDRTQVFRHTT